MVFLLTPQRRRIYRLTKALLFPRTRTLQKEIPTWRRRCRGGCRSWCIVRGQWGLHSNTSFRFVYDLPALPTTFAREKKSTGGIGCLQWSEEGNMLLSPPPPPYKKKLRLFRLSGGVIYTGEHCDVVASFGWEDGFSSWNLNLLQ